MERDDLPRDLRAVQDENANEYCPDCALKRPAVFEQEAATTILKSDDWYDGGVCADCGREL